MQKNTYFIAVTLSMRASQRARNIAAMLCHKFNCTNTLYKIPPHIMLKCPFELTDTQLVLVCDFLSEFAQEHALIDIELKGFDAFDFLIFYWVAFSAQLQKLKRELCDALKQEYPGMEFGMFDREGLLHATVVWGNYLEIGKEMLLFLNKNYAEPERFTVESIDLYVTNPKNEQRLKLRSFALKKNKITAAS